jgi:hypothetical protein
LGTRRYRLGGVQAADDLEYLVSSPQVEDSSQGLDIVGIELRPGRQDLHAEHHPSRRCAHLEPRAGEHGHTLRIGAGDEALDGNISGWCQGRR